MTGPWPLKPAGIRPAIALGTCCGVNLTLAPGCELQEFGGGHSQAACCQDRSLAWSRYHRDVQRRSETIVPSFVSLASVRDHVVEGMRGLCGGYRRSVRGSIHPVGVLSDATRSRRERSSM